MKNKTVRLLLRAKIVLPFRQISALTFIFFFLTISHATAQKKNAFLNTNSASWGFVKNEGQIANDANKEIKYYGNFSNLQVFFYKDKVEFVARKNRTVKEENAQSVISIDPKNNNNELPEKTEILVAKMQMHFQDHNTENIKIQASAKSQSVNNFFLNGQKILHAPTYNQIRYLNIYPHIDLVFKTDINGLKYEFEVRPGGKVSDIKLHWQGADISLKEGNVSYTCMLGKLQEQQPVSYISNGEKIPSGFKLKNNTVTFSTNKYPANQTLTIDPLLRWSTYFGGDTSEGAKDVAVDSKGNVYMLGSTASHTNIATSGSFRDTIAYPTTTDVFLAKFSSSGQRLWSTYYGGTNLEYGYSVAIDKDDNIYIGGLTGSVDFMATTGAHQTSNSGGGPNNHEGFLAKFDSSGDLKWSTYYGGARVDAVTALACDKFGHVFITGYTKSSDKIASTNGHRTLFAGGGTGNHSIGGDAFLAKFDADNGKLKWGTYYGGAGDDFSLTVTADANGHAFIAGQTISTTLIATTGSHQKNRGGTGVNYDGFLAKFDSSGALEWGTYYGGAADDHIAGISHDENNNIYLIGTTNSSDNIASAGAHMESKSLQEDMFIASFNTDGNRKWATYFGGESLDVGEAIGISPDFEVFFTGSTSSYGLATSNAEKQNFADWLDVITGKFDSSGNLNWASYYGGEGIDNVEAIAVQAKETFYITGYTASTVEIAVMGSHQEMLNGFGDAFLVKYDTLGFCYGLAKPGISGDTVICNNATTNYTTFYNPLYAYRWEVDGGTILLGKYSDSVIVRWATTGTRSIRVVRINEFNCIDSTEIMIDVKDVPVADFSLSSFNICLNDSAGFNAKTNSVDYTWHLGDGTTSKQRTLKHAYKSPGTYEVKLLVKSPEGCVDSMIQAIEVIDLSEAGFSINKLSGFTYNFMADDTTYAKYTWQINGVTSYSGAKAKHTFSSNGKYKITLITENANGCKNSQSDSLIIEPNSIADLAANNAFIDIYPNPFHRSATVNIMMETKGSLNIGLYDANGRYINISKNTFLPQGNYQFNISADEYNLQAGIYLLYINLNDKAYTKKLVRLE